MKGFKAGKVSDGKIRKPETFDLFNTTTINNTEGLDLISTDRCITIRIPKIANKEYDKEPDFKESIWKEIRDELYILGLKYPHKIAIDYELVKSDKLRGRTFSIIKPELTIAKQISDEIYNNIEEWWYQEVSDRIDTDYETDWEFNAFKRIYHITKPEKDDSTNSTNSTSSTSSTSSTNNEYFSLSKDVVDVIGEELYKEEYQKKKRSMSTVIGKSLNRNPIFKKRLVQGKTEYRVDYVQFESLLDAKGWLKIIQEKKEKNN